MSSKTMKLVAAELVSAIRAHVAERLSPFDLRIRELEQRATRAEEVAAALESRLAELEQKSARLRAVA